MTALEKSIDSLYSAFAGVTNPETIYGCECCISESELELLLSCDVRSIPSDVLSPYASSALLTVGSIDDYLYLIPRILQAHLNEEWHWPDIEVTGRAIGSTDPSNWPAERLGALRSFLLEVITSLLAPARAFELDSWICAIGAMGIPVRTYLDQIGQSPETVIEYFDCNAPAIQQGRLSNAFWEMPNAAHDEIVDWFYSEPIRKMIEGPRGDVLPDRGGPSV